MRKETWATLGVVWSVSAAFCIIFDRGQAAIYFWMGVALFSLAVASIINAIEKGKKE